MSRDTRFDDSKTGSPERLCTSKYLLNICKNLNISSIIDISIAHNTAILVPLWVHKMKLIGASSLDLYKQVFTALLRQGMTCPHLYPYICMLRKNASEITSL